MLSDSNEKLQSQWEMRTGCLQFSEIWETAEPIGNFNSHAYFPLNATVKKKNKQALLCLLLN